MGPSSETMKGTKAEPKPIAPSVSLPTGGGAIRGIGEKFALRPEHYPYWGQGRLKVVQRVEVMARSTADPVPATIDVHAKVNDQGVAAAKDTLARDATQGGLLIGKFDNIPLPATPVGPLKLFFDDKAIKDLWVAVTWGAQ